MSLIGTPGPHRRNRSKVSTQVDFVTQIPVRQNRVPRYPIFRCNDVNEIGRCTERLSILTHRAALMTEMMQQRPELWKMQPQCASTYATGGNT
jgi:hypothetical protein